MSVDEQYCRSVRAVDFAPERWCEKARSSVVKRVARLTARAVVAADAAAADRISNRDVILFALSFQRVSI